LEVYIAENEALKARVRELERCENVPPSQFCRRVADALCEELVLLDEDIAFISNIVKPAEVDPYTSNAGRSRNSDNRKVDSSSPASSQTPQPQSVSEQLLERKWQHGSRAVPHPPSTDVLQQLAEERDEN